MMKMLENSEMYLQKIVSYSPQQNEVGPRVNRAINEKAKSMLLGTNLVTEILDGSSFNSCVFIK